jgi:hypothetical protein
MDVVSITLATAVLVDVVARADLVEVGVLGSVPEVDRLMDALAAKEIPVHVGGVALRTLTRFFAPYAPMRVLVPRAHAEAARDVMAAL